MTSLHNFSQPMGTCRGTALLQLFNIVNEDDTGIVGINNVETSPVAPHFSTLPINSKSLLMKNVVAPNLGGFLNQCFSLSTQGIVFAFLSGEGKVEELPCLEIFGNNELDGLNKMKPAVEKDDKEVTQVKDVVPSQGSVFNFLNGDVCQLFIFLMDFDLGLEEEDISNLDTSESLSKHFSLLDLSSSSEGNTCLEGTRHSVQDNDVCTTISDKTQLTDHYIKEHDDVEWMITDAIVNDNGFSGEIDGNILYPPFHHWHKMFKNDPLSDSLEISNSHQCHGIENCSELLLNCNDSTFPYHQSFGSFSDAHMRLFPGNHDNNTFGDTDSLNDCGTSGYTKSEEFATLEQHPTIGSAEELKFSIPDPDDLMDYLHGILSSPKFLASDQSNGESDNFHFLSLLGNHNSDEVAKPDNLSDSITNSSVFCGKNGNEYEMFDTFGSTTESGIGATTGAFGEIETSSIPSILDTSKIETIRWNWSSREVNSSAFDFDDHEDLLELYGLSEQDIQANDDLFCDSPTWPRKW